MVACAYLLLAPLNLDTDFKALMRAAIIETNNIC